MANLNDATECDQDRSDPNMEGNGERSSSAPATETHFADFHESNGTKEMGKGEEAEEVLPSRRSSEPYTDEGADAVRNMDPVRKSATADNRQNGARSFGPKRVQTSPVEGGTSSRATPVRRSTFMSGMKRTRTNTQPQKGGRDPFEYTFEPASSDSESSMSSDDDDDEEPPREQSINPMQQDEETEDHTSGNEKAPLTEEQKRRTTSRFAIGNGFFRTKGRVSRRDGRLKISINEQANSGYVAKALGRSIRNHLDIPVEKTSHVERPEHRKKREELKLDEAKTIESLAEEVIQRPKLNIVIMVIGSRGDIQPFIKIGKLLRHTYGHRVRIASHPTFRDFVENDADLEFFSVGGDPSELMAFMVKNPGLIPNMSTVWEGEVGKRRAAMAEMFDGFWRACTNVTDNEHDKKNFERMSEKHPFVADAIIANPPSMAHVHIAERLGIPLHMMFTFPYSPTTQFPHPLANIKMRKSNVDANYVNFMSYPLVEMLTWQGLGDIVNEFREHTLGLEPVSALWAPGALYRMKVPYTYLWSPSLVPKPRDWGPEIDIGGFVFLDLASGFTPDKELADFLDAGEPPVYIGFGSIVVDDPDKFTEMIFKAVELAGVRALVSKGWGGFGANNKNTPKNIHMLGNTPHDWLFPRVKAVVHHGGAGTTAIGLKSGKPTMIVPFFGDQPFWGAMVSEAKAGAHECIPYKKLNAERLAEGIKQCLLEESQGNVQKIADSIAKEGDGAENAVKSFQRSLPLAGRRSMRCSILQDRVAVWQVKKSSLRLSALTAEVLHKQGKVNWSDLKLVRHYEWNDFDGPGEPLTGGVGALTDSLYGIGEGFGMVPVRIARHIRKREEHERKKREKKKRKEQQQNRKVEQARRQPDEQNGSINGRKGYADDGKPSPKTEGTNLTTTSTLSADPPEHLPLEVIDDLNWGLKRAGAAILTMPNDFHVAISQGLHNAPRLYGDSTVRKPVKITGVKSGFVAARQEFLYGMYDGWTGLIKQPRGDWEDGQTMAAKFAGLGTGLGKGLGGFVIKNTNAVSAPPAYVVKGLFKYIEKKHDGPGSKAFLRRARIAQGEIDFHALAQEADEEDHEEGYESLLQIQERVDRGWEIYRKLWEEARKEFGPMRSNLVARYRLRKEKKMWDVNGALENVDIAEQALQARKDGHELDDFFKNRKEEMRKAEKPRASAMNEPETTEEKARALAHQKSEERSRLSTIESGEVDEPETPNSSLSTVREDMSESTTATTPKNGMKADADADYEKQPVDDGVQPTQTSAIAA